MVYEEKKNKQTKKKKLRGVTLKFVLKNIGCRKIMNGVGSKIPNVSSTSKGQGPNL